MTKEEEKEICMLNDRLDKALSERAIIEQQLLEGRSALKEGRVVDTAWLSRVKAAFQFKKREVGQIERKRQAIYRKIKQRNRELSHSRERECYYALREYLIEKDILSREDVRNIVIHLEKQLGYNKTE